MEDTLEERADTTFNRECIVCGETFKAKSKRHKKCDRCKHLSTVEREEEKQVAYQEGRFGLKELDDLGEDDWDENYEKDTGYTQEEIYNMFSDDEDEWEDY